MPAFVICKKRGESGPMERASIAELLKYGERITLECKKAENSLPKSVWETYS